MLSPARDGASVCGLKLFWMRPPRNQRRSNAAPAEAQDGKPPPAPDKGLKASEVLDQLPIHRVFSMMTGCDARIAQATALGFVRSVLHRLSLVRRWWSHIHLVMLILVIAALLYSHKGDALDVHGSHWEPPRKSLGSRIV